MTGVRLRGSLMVDETLATLCDAYRREVRWPHGYRINTDARLLLVAVHRMLALKLLTEEEFRQASVVMGCRLGAMDSYEAFDASIAQQHPAPLAFAYALPSMPVAGISVRYGLRGVTATLTGQDDVGLHALRQGVTLLRSARAQRVVVGCWETPSQTRQWLFDENARHTQAQPHHGPEWRKECVAEINMNCRCVLAVLEPGGDQDHDPFRDGFQPAKAAGTDCVTVLAACLARMADQQGDEVTRCGM